MIKFTKVALLLLVVVAAFASFGMSQAAECRPGSPTNHAGSCETNGNDLKCGGTSTPAGATASASTGGIEVCNEDGGDIPIEGRFGGDADCQCIYADGGNDNDAPADGWMRIDSTGPNCGGSNVSYNQGGGSASNCG